LENEYGAGVRGRENEAEEKYLIMSFTISALKKRGLLFGWYN